MVSSVSVKLISYCSFCIVDHPHVGSYDCLLIPIVTSKWNCFSNENKSRLGLCPLGIDWIRCLLLLESRV